MTSPGPDVAGGGIYATGSLGITVVGSRFSGNTGSNGGGIGCLNSDINVVDTVFENNQALGRGANTNDASKCSVVANGQNEVGDGGNGAAISIDGGSDGPANFCGVVFRGNSGNALAGAVGRTPDGAQQTTTFDRCTFDGNSISTVMDANDTSGGGALYFHNSKLVILASTFSNNTADGCGAIQSDGSDLEMTNSTLADNTARTAPGGALCLFGNGGTITNATFSGSTTSGAPGKGIAAHIFAPGTSITVNNSIFANGVSMDGGVPNCLADLSGANDLQWPMKGNTCVTDSAFGDPMLFALGDNGGPTATLAPGAGSAADGQGHGCPATDQTGKARPADGCALGAVQ